MSRASLRSRAAARWAQAESTVSRLLLLAVFAVGLVAQFVKPVGDALEGKAYIGGALLSLVGYVLYSEVQRLNSAHEAQREEAENLRATIRVLSDGVAELTQAQRPHGGADVSPTALAEEFRQALWNGEDVRLAAWGFTGETFAVPLKQLLGSLPPNPRRSVSLRILVPDFTRQIHIPGLVRADGRAADAPGFRAHLVRKIEGYEADLKGMIGRMHHHGQGALSVEFRTLHMSPQLKLYLVNDDQAFEGIYDKIELRPDEYGPAVPPHGPGAVGSEQLLDPIGYDSLLTRRHRDDGPQAREIIRRRRELFDTMWSVAHPLTAGPLTNGSPGPHAAG
ncbi:ATP/GTP-binding protein [Streptomyces sp. NPDC003247]|uniref:ATP/GTP-binding protein n=1 Tax=Streptomyces sp. NPDC003247 TaxID=3364677 RepID=UPI0036890C23